MHKGFSFTTGLKFLEQSVRSEWSRRGLHSIGMLVSTHPQKRLQTDPFYISASTTKMHIQNKQTITWTHTSLGISSH